MEFGLQAYQGYFQVRVKHGGRPDGISFMPLSVTNVPQ